MPTATSTSQPAGPPADAQGRTSIDPTLNVKEKIEDTVSRLDDLRTLDRDHHREMEEQRRYYDQLLRKADRLIRDAEKGRLDALRVNDTTAVARAAQEQNERASQLAAQLVATAEANRVQVAAAATAFRAELVSTIEPLQKRVEEISRAQYEAQGQKTQVAEARESAGDLKPIIDAIAALQTDLALRQGGQQQTVAKRDDTRFYITLAGGAIVALQLYNIIKPGG